MLILVCGKSNDIKIYDMITYEEIQSIKNAHQNKIKGITLLQNDLIATYSTDKNIKIWSFK
jgi:WD40 repeat protein